MEIGLNGHVKRGDTEVRTIDIEASRAVEDNPLFYHNVYTRGDKKIGYLVYNHFTSGPNGYSDRTYDEEMKKIFAGFQAQGVNEFVLDLRYNGGGYENSANMLAGLLIPEASRKRCLLFSLTIRDNPIPMIFVWKRKERQVT